MTSLEAEAVRRGESRASYEVAVYKARNARLWAPDGKPWCHFEHGSIRCVNDPCRNPRHRSVAVALKVSGRR